MKIDFNRLSRNYEKNPLKRGDKIPKDDLVYLYLECGFSYPKIGKIIGKNQDTVRKAIKNYNLVRNEEQVKIAKQAMVDNVRKTSLERYGVTNSMYRLEIKEKLKQTNIDRYGVDNPKKNKEVIEKGKQTCIQKYGVDNPSKNKEIRQKQKDTMMRRYGVEYPSESPEIRAKQIQSHLDKYGVKYPFQNPESLQKIKDDCLEQFGVDNAMKSEEGKQRLKNKFLEKYGVDNPMKDNSTLIKLQQNNLEKYGYESTLAVPQFIENRKKTCMERYGVSNPGALEETKAKVRSTSLKKYETTNYASTEECKRKIVETMKKNKSFGKSKNEESIFSKLISKFPNTIRQYWSEEYPFACDFYIPSLDLYIEYQGYKGHGEEPFDSTNQLHINQVKQWQELSEKRKLTTTKSFTKYDAFIKTWTVKDPLKRRIAKENKLNWLEFFSEKEFDEWYNKL